MYTESVLPTPGLLETPAAAPFTVLWTVLEFLDLRDASSLRRCSAAWRTKASELAVDIAVEAVVAHHRHGREAWRSRNLVEPQGFRCPYLPRPRRGVSFAPPPPPAASMGPASLTHSGTRGEASDIVHEPPSARAVAGLDGERRLVDVVRAWGRADDPPPNVPGLIDALIPRPNRRAGGSGNGGGGAEDAAATAAPVLMVPPVTPFGQLLLHWWEVSAARSTLEAASGSVQHALTINRRGVRHRNGDDLGIFRLPRSVADERLKTMSVRRSRSMADVLRATKPEAPDLAIANSASAAGALHNSLSLNAASAVFAASTTPAASAGEGDGSVENPLLRMLTYRAFDESSSSDDDAGNDLERSGQAAERAAVAGAVAEAKLRKRRQVLFDFVANTRCVFVRATPQGAFERSGAGATAAAVHLVNNVLLPHDRQLRRIALRTSGCTAVTEAPSLGPPDPDYVTVVPFGLSYHTLENLDVVAFALDARPHPITVVGMRVMRGVDGRTNTSVRVVATLRGDVDRPQAALSQLARSWFAELRPPSLGAFIANSAGVACSVCVVDLSGTTSGFTTLRGDTFSGSLLPSLVELYLPADFREFDDKCIVDHPRLRRVGCGELSPLALTYKDPSREDTSCFELPRTVHLGASSIVRIGSDVFRRCHEIASVALPPTLTALGDGAFLRAGGLTKLDLSACVRLGTVPSEFAAWCPKLTAVALPSSVDTFSFGAFRGCTALKHVVGLDTIAAPRVEFQRNAFAGSGLQRVVLPRTTFRFGPGAFNACPRLMVVDLGECRLLREIAPRVFTDCPRLRAVRLPPGIEMLGSRVFSNCPKLAAIDLTPCLALRSIGDGAFEDNPNLSDVAFPGIRNAESPPALKTLGARAFAKCGALLHADLSALPKLKKVGDGAFADCCALIELTLPNHPGVAVGSGVGANASAQFTMTCKEPPTPAEQRAAARPGAGDSPEAKQRADEPTAVGCGEGCVAQ